MVSNGKKTKQNLKPEGSSGFTDIICGVPVLEILHHQSETIKYLIKFWAQSDNFTFQEQGGNFVNLEECKTLKCI